MTLERQDSEAKVVEEQWEGVNPRNPQNWPQWKRRLIFGSLNYKSFIVCIGAAIFAPAVPTVATEFQRSTILTIAAISFYALGLGIGPMVLSPVSEAFGRNTVYIPTWLAFTLFQLGCALTHNIQTLLICRFLTGFLGSAFLAIPAGTIADMWTGKEAGVAIGLFANVAAFGTIIGPILGGYLAQGAGWRWIFWLMLILSGVGALDLVWLPETMKTRIMQQQAKKTGRLGPSAELPLKLFLDTMWRPLRLLFVEPIVFLVSISVALVYGVLYLYFAVYFLVFTEVYGWSEANAQLPFIAILIGNIIGAANLKQITAIAHRLQQKRGRARYPEGILPFAMVAALCAPASMFWFAWTVNKSIHWIVPILSGVLFGWSMMLIFVLLLLYIATAYIELAASAISATGLMRFLFAAAFPLFAPRMYDSLNPHIAGTVLGSISAALAPIPFLLYKFGPWIRSKSAYTFKDL